MVVVKVESDASSSVYGTQRFDEFLKMKLEFTH